MACIPAPPHLPSLSLNSCSSLRCIVRVIWVYSNCHPLGHVAWKVNRLWPTKWAWRNRRKFMDWNVRFQWIWWNIIFWCLMHPLTILNNGWHYGCCSLLFKQFIQKYETLCNRNIWKYINTILKRLHCHLTMKNFHPKVVFFLSYVVLNVLDRYGLIIISWRWGVPWNHYKSMAGAVSHSFK